MRKALQQTRTAFTRNPSGNITSYGFMAATSQCRSRTFALKSELTLVLPIAILPFLAPQDRTMVLQPCFFKMWYKAATDKLLHIFLPTSGHSREGLSSSAHSLQKSQPKSGLQSQPQRLVISDKLHHLKTGLNKDIKFTSNKPQKDQMGTQNNFKTLNRYKLFSRKFCYSNPENENMTNFWKSHLLS